MTDMVEGEAVEVTGTELEVRAPAPTTLFRTDDPDEMLVRATATADALARVVRDKKLATSISGRDHVRVEGWTLLGSMLGVFAVCTETRQVADGWHARVEARTLAGAVVGAAEAECLRTESKWKSRDDYALLSMAQTRATSKALRQPLGFVMTLAGFDPTPSEEMPTQEARQVASKPSSVTKKQTAELDALLTKLETEAPKAEGMKTYREDVRYFCEHTLGVADPTKLTRDQFDSVIEEVKRWVKDEALPIA